MRFIVISLRKYFFTIIFLLFIIFLILFSSTNFTAATDGLILWANSIVPTLLPFFIATELLCRTNFIQIVGKYLNKFMKPIFNVPGESAIAIVIGFISGYPVGSTVVCNLYKNKICSKAEAERLISFTNNSGPFFILGTVGISLLGDNHIGRILLISHIISALIVGFIFRFWKKNQVNLTFRNYNSDSKELVKLSNLGEILSEAIKKSIINVLQIGGFIVLFSVVISILESLNILTSISGFLCNLGIPYDISLGILTGFIEITNGLETVANCYNSIPLVSILTTSFILGIGGLSVLLQIYSIISKYKLSIRPYIYGKFLQGVLSVIITYLLIKI